MGTRHYCDHCGNTIKEQDKGIMGFGPYKAIEEHKERLQYHHGQAVAMQQLSSRQQLTPVPYAPPPLAPSIVENFPAMEVDLCKTCIPIWYSRVQKLTKSSDPE